MAGILRHFVALADTAALVNQTHTLHKLNHSSLIRTAAVILDRVNGTTTENITSLAMERERVRMEFYATYDVMTGIRIAATLSGFFLLMIVLVLYKSRSKTNQALRDPKIVAVAAAVVMEEEERELQESLEATGLSMYCDDMNKYRQQRLLSFGNISAPPSYGFRLPQIGGFDSISESPRRFSYAGSRRLKKHISSKHKRRSYEVPDQAADEMDEDEFIEAENEFEEIEIQDYNNPVSMREPQCCVDNSRRCSSITCCSTESSFLERRCSALTLGIYSIGPSLANNTDSFISHTRPTLAVEASISEFSGANIYPSSATLLPSSYAIRSERRRNRDSLRQNRRVNNSTIDDFSEDATTTTYDSSTLKRARAPLASLTSFKISSVDYHDSDLKSLGSDSVFRDTDEEIEQFSSDTCDSISNMFVQSDAEDLPNDPDDVMEMVEVSASANGGEANDNLEQLPSSAEKEKRIIKHDANEVCQVEQEELLDNDQHQELSC